MKIFLCILFFACSILSAPAQPSGKPQLQQFLVKRIAEQQVREDKFFLPGIFPSYINNKERFSQKKKDLTIFYNALIDETLQQLSPSLSASEKKTIKELYARSATLYSRFKNQKGRSSYNFWVRDSLYTFPYSWWIPLIKKDPHVPDDMDDTSLSHLALNSPKDTAAAVHSLFGRFANKPEKPLRTVHHMYRTEPAYSTWFGKKFPVVFDVSVLANTLFFVQSHHLAWTAADSASLRVILQSIDTRDYIKNPMLISPYYGKPSIILYHFARLMSVKNIPGLEQRKPELITAASGFFITSQSTLEKTILSTALKRWGVETGFHREIIQRFAAGDNFVQKEIEESNFSFFIGNIPSYFPFGIKKIFTRLDALMYYHFCPAYNNVLLLEYLTMSEE